MEVTCDALHVCRHREGRRTSSTSRWLCPDTKCGPRTPRRWLAARQCRNPHLFPTDVPPARIALPCRKTGPHHHPHRPHCPRRPSSCSYTTWTHHPAWAQGIDSNILPEYRCHGVSVAVHGCTSLARPDSQTDEPRVGWGIERLPARDNWDGQPGLPEDVKRDPGRRRPAMWKRSIHSAEKR